MLCPNSDLDSRRELAKPLHYMLNIRHYTSQVPTFGFRHDLQNSTNRLVIDLTRKAGALEDGKIGEGLRFCLEGGAHRCLGKQLKQISRLSGRDRSVNQRFGAKDVRDGCLHGHGEIHFVVGIQVEVRRDLAIALKRHKQTV